MVTTATGPRVGVQALRRVIAELFETFGVPPNDAAIAAEVLVAADLHGVDSHGTARLTYYVNKLERGLINPRPQIRVAVEAPVCSVVDGDNGLGQVVSQFAMDYCIRRAREAGAACVTVGHSNHFGIAGYYALQAVSHGMIGVALTNASPMVAPTFGKDKMLGANPIAVAVPTARERPFLLDMSTSAVAAGKLQLAMMAGEQIPVGWAIDADGAPTTDPIAGLQGALLPLGSTRTTSSHKGYGLAVVVDVLCALLSGAAWGPQCGGLTRDFNDVSNVGHFFAAIRVDAFRPLSEFTAQMDEMIRGLKTSALAPGEDRIFVHGEPEFEEAERRERDGIPLDPNIAEYLRTLATERGLQDKLPPW